MMIRTKLFAAGIAGAGMIALAGFATPAAAQYAPQYTPHVYGGAHTQAAAQRCAAAVQHRLSGKTTVRGFFEHVGGRVLAVTEVRPRRNLVRVRGTAVSDRLAYGPYGYGAYGATGYAYSQQPGDLSFRCDVDYRGRILKIDINRR